LKEDNPNIQVMRLLFPISIAVIVIFHLLPFSCTATTVDKDACISALVNGIHFLDESQIKSDLSSADYRNIRDIAEGCWPCLVCRCANWDCSKMDTLWIRCNAITQGALLCLQELYRHREQILPPPEAKAFETIAGKVCRYMENFVSVDSTYGCRRINWYPHRSLSNPDDIEDTSIYFLVRYFFMGKKSEEFVKLLSSNRDDGSDICVKGIWAKIADVPTGAFLTWLRPYPEKAFQDSNDICLGAASNAIFLLGVLDSKTTPGFAETVTLINKVAEMNLQFSFPSEVIRWYAGNPYAFGYNICRAYADGGVVELRPAVSAIQNELLSEIDDNSDSDRMRWRYSDNFEIVDAYAANCLMDAGYTGNAIDRLIAEIISAQNPQSGSWRADCVTGSADQRIKQCSSQWSTAICMEAIAKYLMIRYPEVLESKDAE